MKLKLCAVIIAILASQAQAKSVGVTTSITDDNEGSSSVHVDTSYMFNDNLGVRYGKTNYQTPAAIDLSNRYSLMLNTWVQGTRIFGDLGVGNISGKSYFIGDMTAYRTLNKHMAIFAGIDGDIVDSDRGIEETITYKGWTAGIDLYTDKFGITGSLREQNFTDGNIKEGWFAKLYYVPFNGISIYASTKHYNNSKENNGNYYSPGKYERDSVGIAYRYVIKDYLLSGHAEIGKQGSTADFENANAFKVSIGPAVRKKWTWRVSYLTDRSGDSNYRYNTLMAEIVYDL